MKEERNFIKITNKLFYNYKGDSLIQECKNYYLVDIMAYLYEHKSLYTNEVIITLDLLILGCGYKPNKHKGKINDKFKECLEFLRQKGYIISDINFVEDKYSAICIKLNLDTDKEFTQIYQDQIDTIKNYTGKTDKTKLLFLFGYIASREPSIKNPEDIYHKLSEKALYGDLAVQVFYDSLKNISAHLGLSETTISNYINILKDLKLIQITNLTATKNKGQVKSGVTLYTTLTGEIGKQHLKVKKKQLEYSSTTGEKITIKDNDKSLDGKIAREKQLISQGKGDIDKYNSLIKEKYPVEINVLENRVNNYYCDGRFNLPMMEEYIGNNIKDLETYNRYIEYVRNNIDNVKEIDNNGK